MQVNIENEYARGYKDGKKEGHAQAQAMADALEMVKRTISSLIQPALWNQQIDDDQRELLKVRDTIEIALQQFKDKIKC